MTKLKEVKRKKKLAFTIDNEKCFYCNKKVNKKFDNYVDMTTYNQGKLIEKVIFHVSVVPHLNCWGMYNDQRFKERFNENINFGLSTFTFSVDKDDEEDD